MRDRLNERLVLPHAVLAEVDGLEEAQLELGGQEAEHPKWAEPRERRRERGVEKTGQLLQRVDLGEDRSGFLRADDAHRHDRRLRAHRRLDETTASEATQ